jgi:hypothetical protein
MFNVMLFRNVTMNPPYMYANENEGEKCAAGHTCLVICVVVKERAEGQTPTWMVVDVLTGNSRSGYIVVFS